MRLLSKTPKIDFMAWRKPAAVVSIIMLLISVASLSTRQLNWGIDFSGGVLVEVGYPADVELDPIRAVLDGGGYPEAVVQYFGSSTDVMIRLAPQGEGSESSQLAVKILDLLKTVDANAELRRIEFVGPQVGEELTNDGGLAMLWALGCIFVYVLFRFHWKFSMGAVAALVHDVLITLGFFSVLGLEFDLSVLAAVLAVIGYSLNDTIVVFDRCRENFNRKTVGGTTTVFNLSINQMLARTLVTSLTTLLVLLALFSLGGEAIHGFAIALIVGVIIGTYSSIFVAGSTSVALHVTRDELLPPEIAEDERGDGALV